jgi:hypothetical protein
MTTPGGSFPFAPCRPSPCGLNPNGGVCALPTTKGGREDTATELSTAVFACDLLPEVPGGYECVRKTSCDRSALECRSDQSEHYHRLVSEFDLFKIS